MPDRKVRHKIWNSKTRNRSKLAFSNYRWTFFSYNIVGICVYTGVHVTGFFFLTALGANSFRARLVGHYMQEIDLAVKLSRFFFPPLSWLTSLGWGKSLTFQDRFVITDPKDGLGRCLKKNNEEFSALCEEVLVPSNHDTSCVILKGVYKLNGRCFLVISLGVCGRSLEKGGTFHDR